jgi:hemerythrin
MDLEWESDFETGNEYIDLQHHYFLDLINRIKKTFKETNDVYYKEKLINELKKYADFHFTSEENLATSHNLPEDIRSHHLRHLELLEEYDHHAEDLDKGLKTIDEFIGFLSDWFVGHTIYEDQKLFKKII